MYFRLDESGVPVCVSEDSAQCPCLENFSGQFCDQCAPGYYNFPECQRKYREIFSFDRISTNLKKCSCILTKLKKSSFVLQESNLYARNLEDYERKCPFEMVLDY